MKKYKVRFNCNGYVDVAVKAASKLEAVNEARRVARPCEFAQWEFCEFLPLEDGDEIEN